MLNVVLDMRGGPMAGARRTYDLAAPGSVGESARERLILGRDPGPGGCLLDGDASVSRKHGALLLDGPWLVFENLSSNGTVLARRVVMGRERLEPGAVLRIGRHEIEVSYELPAELTAELRAGASQSLLSSGPLANPLVRGAVAVYLFALVALALLLAGGGDGPSRSFTDARRAYEVGYLPDQVELEEARRRSRLDTVDRLRLELEAQLRSEQWTAARDTCRRLMEVDGDPRSPIYRFAALRLAELARKG